MNHEELTHNLLKDYKCRYCGTTDHKRHKRECWYMKYAYKAPESKRNTHEFEDH